MKFLRHRYAATQRPGCISAPVWGWKYSSAIDYYGGKGLLEIIMLDTLIVETS